MKKFNLAKALSEFLAVSTIAISIAQGGTIIGGNISFHGVATSSQVQPGSITIQSENIPSFSSVNWQLYQFYQDQNVCMKLYGATWNPQAQYVTIPQGVHQVSITVEPYNLNTGIVATFPGSVLGGQTLTLYVAPLSQGMYSYGVDQATPYQSPFWNDFGGTDSNGNSVVYIASLPSSEFSPYYYIHSNSLPCIDTFEDYSLTSSNIQNVTVELSNGTVLIGPNSNGSYYVSNLASSSTMFIDNLGYYAMLTTPEYVKNESLYYNIDYLPPFYKASCVAYDQTNHGCLAQMPDGLPEVIITWQ